MSSLADEVAEVFSAHGLKYNKKNISVMCAECDGFCQSGQNKNTIDMGYRKQNRPKMTQMDCGCGVKDGKADIVVPSKPKQYY